jgi:hypothetical protein
MKIRIFHLLIISLILLSQSACAKEPDRGYVNKDPKACATLSLSCEKNQHPFYDDTGCGCTAKTAAESKHYYVNQDPKVCSSLLFKCQAGQNPFFDEHGCGCQFVECGEPDQKLSSNSEYQLVEIKDAGVSFEIPKTWSKQGDQNQWSPNPKNTSFIGFKWTKIEESSHWQPIQMLPKQGSILGPYNIDLSWEHGLLFVLQFRESEKKVEKFEIHTIIPRMEAGIAYDFYARADSFEQLKTIEAVHQRFILSGSLNTIKRYLSNNPEQCRDLELNCDANEEDFSDDTGCGCLSKPVEDAVYDN